MKTLNEQYQLIKEGKGHKGMFLKEARSKFPQWIRNASTLKETTTILKNKGIINENLVDVKSSPLVSPPKESYETAFSNFLKEAKAKEKKVSKEVEENLDHNYTYKDKEDPNNMIFDQIMTGYYAEMKNPENSKKTMEELKAIVLKNLSKDPIYYTKNGQFGIEDLGYQEETPGLGKGKQVKDAGPGGGYGTPTKKDFPEGQVGTGYVEVPKKIEGSSLVVIDVTTLNENKDLNTTTENLHEQKLRKVINNIIREELNENVQKELKSIDKEAEVETIKMKIERIEAAIEKRQNQLSKLDEDEDLKNLTDKKKLKALGKDVKVLEKAKAKLEKTLAKLTGKKKKVLEDTVTEAEGDAEDAGELADELERAKEAADALAGTELFEDEEGMAEIATEAETMFEKLTGRDGGSGKMNEMDALKDVLSQFDSSMTKEIAFVEKHLMGKYDLGNA